MNAKTKAAVQQHGENLLAIFPHATEQDPIKLCSKLRKLEREGEALGLKLCNGPEFPNEDDADKISKSILKKVNALLGNRIVPIFVNRDPRGYALKIDDKWMHKHPKFRLHTDLGGYGILAPDLNQ
jgi:hypothetical protein